MIRASCVGCIYHRQLGDAETWGCHYLLDTGELRGCPAHTCTKKKYPDSKKIRTQTMLRAIRYFSECRGRVVLDEKGAVSRAKDGTPLREGVHPPTITGLALALGFCSKQDLKAAAQTKELGDIIRWSLSKCEEYLEERLCESAAGIKLSLMNHFSGWNETPSDESHTEIHVTLEGEMHDQTSQPHI